MPRETLCADATAEAERTLRRNARMHAAAGGRERGAALGMRSTTNWFVIQVSTGKELAMCQVIERVAGEVGDGVLKECFCPSYATQKKVRGVWQNVQAILFPGYVIAVSDAIGELKDRLRRVEEFTRLLSIGEAFVPLEESDRAWIAAFTHHGERVIPMSMGVVEGDRVVVFQGPLMGHEGWIKRVDRRRSIAFIQVNMFGRTIETKIGLGIVRKKPCKGI